jgi:hypothetical protein
VPLRKQPLVHVFPGEEAPRKPEPPPNRILGAAPPGFARLLISAIVALAAALLVMLAMAAGDMIHGHP